MFNILVTGSNSQLSFALKELVPFHQYDNFYFKSKEELDITSLVNLETFFNTQHIDVIINCAAYTNVNQAEIEFLEANKINCLGVKNLAIMAKQKNIKLIHISTDYVFDGSNNVPYTELNITNPLSAYGKSKLEGEKAMLLVNPQDSIIIRTAWMYSNYGNNFLKTILKLGEVQKSINVVYDQLGTPTYAGDVAQTILKILPFINNKNVETYHYSNEGSASWYDFAHQIIKETSTKCNVIPVLTKDYPSTVKRPHYSLLSKEKIKTTYNISIPHWLDSLSILLKNTSLKHNQ